MAYRLTRKNLAVKRLLPKDDAHKRLKYVHVGHEGTTVSNGYAIARVTLPEQDTKSKVTSEPRIFPNAKGLNPPKSDSIETALDGDFFTVDGGLPATTTAEHAVTNLDKAIPKPEDQALSFTCDAALLATLLEIAASVSEQPKKVVRLRICPKKSCLRIDTLSNPGEQSFVGVIAAVGYMGKNIAGDPPVDSGNETYNDTPTQSSLPLPVVQGRKFRS
jgi:hypothetical protein